MSALVQPFPKEGVLAKNLNLTVSQLIRQVGYTEEGCLSYILRSVKLDRSNLHFEQRGSAPNFQGGYLTLCTCKHQMRSSLIAPQWNNSWIAGFTSRCIHKKRHWLFYLTRVAAAHESHFDLWDALPETVRDAKSAQEHFLGDLYTPKTNVSEDDRFNPRRYFVPSRHSHRKNTCDSSWHNDINYKYSHRYGRPSLLLGEPQLTFLWDRPIIFYDENHCRNYLKWERIIELLPHLTYEAS